MSRFTPQRPPHNALGDATESTLASRRHHVQPHPLLKDADIAPHHPDSSVGQELRSGELRVVNVDYEGLDTGASGPPTDLQSDSSMPYNRSVSGAGGFAEDDERRSRWKDSTGRKSPVPSSFGEAAVGIIIKIRLLPVMVTLMSDSEKVELQEALTRAQACLDFAVAKDTSQALQGRICYYIGVTMHLLDDKDALKYFVGAVDAKDVYEEGRWARQWINLYESIADLSPNRFAISESPTHWKSPYYSNLGYLKNVKHTYELPADLRKPPGYKEEPIESGKAKRRSEDLREPPAKGVQVTTPVKQRFSLDTRDDLDKSLSLMSVSDFRRSSGSDINGGEPPPSVSSWGSSFSSRTIRPSGSQPVTADGSHSPKSTNISPTQRSKSVTFETMAQGPEVTEQEPLGHRRRQSSVFNVNTAASIMKRQTPIT